MNKQVMIDKIYEVIADKSLTFGCKLLRTSNDGSQKTYYTLEPTPFGKLHISSMPFGDMTIEVDPDGISRGSGDEYKTIGHPVMIGDVLDWIENDLKYVDDFCKCRIDGNARRTLIVWTEKRKPLENQPDECILFIYNLINEL